MQRILVSLDSVKRKLSEIEKDNMEYIEFNIVPRQVDNTYIHPAFLHFDGLSKNGFRKDYESIDTLPLHTINSRKYKPVLIPLPF
ncbi:MAG: Phage protein [Eubacteriales bacterium]|jgi:hypothetical protein